MRLIAATHNAAKLRAIRRVVGADAVVEPLPNDISFELSDEHGQNVSEIAIAKAIAGSNALGRGTLVIASDGGLTIPALGESWNPSRTRRFAGEFATDLERAERLLALTAHLSGSSRAIGWREALAIACDGGLVAEWTAASDDGLLSYEIDPGAIPRADGFWIPALWRCPEYDGRLLAELSDEECEHRVDHWRRLEAPVRAWLREQANFPYKST